MAAARNGESSPGQGRLFERRLNGQSPKIPSLCRVFRHLLPSLHTNAEAFRRRGTGLSQTSPRKSCGWLTGPTPAGPVSRPIRSRRFRGQVRGARTGDRGLFMRAVGHGEGSASCACRTWLHAEQCLPRRVHACGSEIPALRRTPVEFALVAYSSSRMSPEKSPAAFIRSGWQNGTIDGIAVAN